MGRRAALEPPRVIPNLKSAKTWKADYQFGWWKHTLPTNTTATVWLPASAAAAVHKSGKLLNRAVDNFETPVSASSLRRDS
jgi:hypothetical protein